jgi:hypothetical protein
MGTKYKENQDFFVGGKIVCLTVEDNILFNEIAVFATENCNVTNE